MDKVRIATQEEVEKIAKGSDLSPLSTVVAFENQKTGQPDLAVLRQVFELDPVHYAPETSDRRKVLFAWAIENALRLQGTIAAYYFNISADDSAEEWRKVVESYGAERISPTAEYRYKKLLN